MTDQLPLLEQTVAHHNNAMRAIAQAIANAQINEILLLIARRQQETVQIQQENAQQIAANTQQIATNAQAIAELRATIQDRYGGNGQRGE